MEKTVCGAFAKSTQKQCSNKALLGTNYCWMHYPKKGPVIFLFIGALLSTIFPIVYDSLTVSDEEKKMAELKVGNDTLLKENKLFKNKIEELVAGNDELLTKNSELLEEIKKYQLDLDKKEEQIKELEVKAQQAQKGITKVFYFNGAIRKTDGPTISIDNKLRDVYKHMIELDQEKSYDELKTVCNEQIERNPEWPTPYLFLGVSLGNTGEIEKSIDQLKYFLKIAPTNPTLGYINYRVQAEQFINLAKNQ